MAKIIETKDGLKKVIVDGKVAVLCSPGYGAGWYSWGNDRLPEQALFHPTLVELVEQDRQEEITKDLLVELFGEDARSADLCIDPDQDKGLSIEWVPIGEKFHIIEYDGSENVELLSEIKWITA